MDVGVDHDAESKHEFDILVKGLVPTGFETHRGVILAGFPGPMPGAGGVAGDHEFAFG